MNDKKTVGETLDLANDLLSSTDLITQMKILDLVLTKVNSSGIQFQKHEGRPIPEIEAAVDRVIPGLKGIDAPMRLITIGVLMQVLVGEAITIFEEVTEDK